MLTETPVFCAICSSLSLILSLSISCQEQLRKWYRLVGQSSYSSRRHNLTTIKWYMYKRYGHTNLKVKQMLTSVSSLSLILSLSISCQEQLRKWYRLVGQSSYSSRRHNLTTIKWYMYKRYGHTNLKVKQMLTSVSILTNQLTSVNTNYLFV